MLPFDRSVGGISSVSAVLLFLATFAIALRFIARKMQKTPFGVDGWLTIPAWICFLGIVVDACYAMVHQVLAAPEPSDKSALMSIFSTFTETQYVAFGLSIGSVGFTRLSTLFFYRRIFVNGRNHGVFNVLTIIAIVITCMWILGFTLQLVFDCGTNFSEMNQPIAAIACDNLNILKSVSISSFILDALVLILPVPMIFGLHTTIGRRLGIAGVFLLATAGVTASCARMAINIYNTSQGPSTGHRDSFLENTQLYYYVILEAGLCLLATNLPCLWYFIGHGTLPERVIRSVRSLISLGSIHSTDNNKSKDLNAANDGMSSNSGIETTREFHVEYSNETSDMVTQNSPETKV